MLAPELVKELEKLQDRVPPFATAKAVSIIEEQLGAPVDTLFDDFDRTPIAAASLGQARARKLHSRRVRIRARQCPNTHTERNHVTARLPPLLLASKSPPPSCSPTLAMVALSMTCLDSSALTSTPRLTTPFSPQVHRATVNGRKVVVKVQRPGLRELFEVDLKNLRVIAQWLQKVDPKTDGAARDWVAIFDECQSVLLQEIDYTNEGKNAEQFRTNFAGQPWVKVPEILWAQSGQRVLTMEYCPGLKINRVDEIESFGLDRELLARYSVESYLQQILRYGFFHADPHPGNIAVDAGHPGGRLVFYDFGMMGRIQPGIRGGLLALFYAIYERDANRCLDALVTMGVLVPGGDLTAVRRTAQFFLNSFEEV